MTVQAVDTFTPYSTVTAMFAALPTWMNEADAERISAYQVYEQIYWNVPDTFKLVMRGEEDMPIYIPNGRVIVDTTNRFLCPRPGFIMDPDAGSPVEQETMRLMLSNTFKRERFWAKYASNKRFGIMRGDWCWHIIGNPLKAPGKRIKIEPLDPGAYFPVTHPDDPDRIIAAHIVEQFDRDGEVVIKRQTYQKGADPLNNDGTDTTIYNSIALFATEAWEALDDKAIEVIKPPTALPPQITAIPIYHIPNLESPGDPFGSSELRGFERIMGAINQAISDEEIILALEGLGMYETDGGPPRDENGNITDWVLGPGRVVEHTSGSSFGRVTGVSSVTPMMDHLAYLTKSLKEASATPDIAVGSVDVTVAESGVSRLLQFGPLLAKVEERGEIVEAVHAQMFYDLSQGFAPAYEQIASPAVAVPIYGQPLPNDRDSEFTEIMTLFTNGIVDAEWVRTRLAALGYDFPADTGVKVLNEQQARARATDPFVGRMDLEENTNA